VALVEEHWNVKLIKANKNIVLYWTNTRHSQPCWAMPSRTLPNSDMAEATEASKTNSELANVHQYCGLVMVSQIFVS
jgi:hypothetical protein